VCRWCCRLRGSDGDASDVLVFQVWLPLAAEVWRLWSGAGGATSEGELRLAVEGFGLSRPDQERSKIGACRPPTIVCVPDPVLRGWWLLRSIVALWLGVLPAPGAAAEAGGVRFRWRREDDGCLRVVFRLYPLWCFLYFLVLMYPCYFMNTSFYLSKKVVF
jgi:hypothetical protein